MEVGPARSVLSPTYCDVLQGSVLAPVLFFITHHSHHGLQYMMYADDIQLFMHIGHVVGMLFY